MSPIYDDEKILLSVEHLTTRFIIDKKSIPIIHDITFSIKKGEILGIVGESGCGKSVTSLSILNLLGKNAEIDTHSKISFNGIDLTKLNSHDLAKIRGKDISMIFQDPMTSLNPVKTIGNQIGEALAIHSDLSNSDIKKKVLDMLAKVGIPAPELRYHEYPHQLSGGMKQRVMIAMALICKPKLLIADEPTTALDVTTQAQILNLIRHLNKEFNTSVILITHDMGVVASMADDVAVMYAGRIVEYNNVYEIFKNPIHPYTHMLLQSIPRLDQNTDVLPTIPGSVPSPQHLPNGCKFYPRCPWATAECKGKEPEMKKSASGYVRCWLKRGDKKNERIIG